MGRAIPCAPANTLATAAVLTQSIAWANLQRPFDPGLQTLSEEDVEQATVDMLLQGLVFNAAADVMS